MALVCDVYCDLVTFPFGILGQVWCLNVSIPDPCCLSYFKQTSVTFCCTLLYVHSSIAIILMGKRELIALLNLSSWCLVMVERCHGLSAVCDCGIS